MANRKPPSAPWEPRARLAVLDADASFRDTLREFLEAEGFELRLYREAWHAHEWLRSLPPDMLLLDLSRPDDVARWELLRMLRLDPATRAIKVVAYSTALAALRDCEPLLSMCEVDLFPKPFDFDDLLHHIVARLAAESPAAGQAA